MPKHDEFPNVDVDGQLGENSAHECQISIMRIEDLNRRGCQGTYLQDILHSTAPSGRGVGIPSLGRECMYLYIFIFYTNKFMYFFCPLIGLPVAVI